MKWILGALAASVMVAPASAAVLTLQNVTANAPGDFTFSYQATLGPDEGVRTGDRFVIYDFGGYIDGSVFSASPNLIASVENISPGTLITPGFTDDASIANLVFTYTGPAFHDAGGPFPPFSFPTISARSAFGGTVLDAFFSLTRKNNSTAEAGRPLYMLGSVSVPFHAVPEPATWAMMLGGFGMLGFAARRRKALARVTA